MQVEICEGGMCQSRTHLRTLVQIRTGPSSQNVTWPSRGCLLYYWGDIEQVPVSRK